MKLRFEVDANYTLGINDREVSCKAYLSERFPVTGRRREFFLHFCIFVSEFDQVFR